MKKTDLIKFRCTPAFKAQLVREATYRGVSLSELCEEQLAPLARSVTASGYGYARQERSTTEKLVEYGLQNSGLAAQIEAEKRSEVTALAQVGAYPTTGDMDLPGDICEHGRPSPRVCWECA